MKRRASAGPRRGRPRPLSGQRLAWAAVVILNAACQTAQSSAATVSAPTATAPVAPPPSRRAAAPAPITPAEIEGHLRFLADDLLAGRGIGSPGLALAAAYHEARFRSLGLAPAFGQRYRQPLTVAGSSPDPQATLSLQAGRYARELTYLKDFVLVGHRQDSPASLQGELVYGGYLIQAPGRGWDDIKGVDLRGKILLVEVNEPGNRPGGRFDGQAMTYFGRWTYKYEQASRLGAAGVLLVHDRQRAAYGWEVVRRSWSGEDFFLPAARPQTHFEGWLQQAVVRQALAAAGQSYDALLAAAERPDFRPVPLGVTVQVRQRPRFRQLTVENVAAVLRGGHPDHRGQAVIVSAHFDHLGQDPAAGQDTIYNGAVDNCSASAALLALARRLSAQAAALPLDVVFLAATAEEAGLLGSRHFAQQLPLEPATVLAAINFEMTNVWGETEDVYAIGGQQSTLDEVCRQAAAALGLRYLPEQERENGFFFRSDQLSFARVGIPAVWLHEGQVSRGPDPTRTRRLRAAYREQHYHQQSDEVAQLEAHWDLRGTAQIASWAEAIVWQLAKTAEPPRFLPTSAFRAADEQRHLR